MKVVDANVLLYAADQESRFHEVSRGWLVRALGGAEPIVVPWVVALAFLRLSTRASIFSRPLTVAEAVGFLRLLQSSPVVVAAEPDPSHLDRVAALLDATATGGNIVNDAHVAALALALDGTIVSFDNDFDRFPGVRWARPDGT